MRKRIQANGRGVLPVIESKHARVVRSLGRGFKSLRNIARLGERG
jgi:hypothetical protein